jgi:hypothetical protein
LTVLVSLKKESGKCKRNFTRQENFFEWRGTAGERPPNYGRLIAECGFSKKEAKLSKFVTVWSFEKPKITLLQRGKNGIFHRIPKKLSSL